MNKQDEEKARKLSKKFARQYHANNWPEWSDDEAFHFSNEEIYNACLEMASWKEQQIIEKAILFLRQHNCTIAATIGMEKAKQFIVEIEDFKKYMLETNELRRTEL